MSYIRSTGNPEKMYIWGEANGNVIVMKGPDTIGSLPTKVFDGLIKKYIKNNCPDDCEYKGASISEEWIPIAKDKITEGMRMMSISSEPMVVLKYGDWKVVMYDVTWYYIARSNVK